ncbi:MAG: helix-turn-helix domain-containing protein [Acidobacteriota bacterium]
MTKPKLDKPKGILHSSVREQSFRHARHFPSDDLQFFIEHFWMVSWDLRGQQPHLAESLPYPSVHIVIEKGRAEVIGVVTGKFSRLLEGQGRVFGIKFKPGAFYPFWKAPVSQLSDGSISIQEVFGTAGELLAQAILAEDEQTKRIAIAEEFLRARLPEPDENVALINLIIDRTIANREITQVDDIVRLFDMNKRTLQRIFSQYVGVSPKWVIKRYRLHEAAEQLASGEVVDWPKVALELGYFDQAHFIKDFKTIVGESPAEYTKKINLIPKL